MIIKGLQHSPSLPGSQEQASYLSQPDSHQPIHYKACPRCCCCCHCCYCSYQPVSLSVYNTKKACDWQDTSGAKQIEAVFIDGNIACSHSRGRYAEMDKFHHIQRRTMMMVLIIRCTLGTINYLQPTNEGRHVNHTERVGVKDTKQ